MVILPSIRRKYMVSRIPWGATVPMSQCVVTLASDRASYTGAARTVGVTVTWEGATLAVNTDYTLSFANNTNVGPATVTVTGMGQFSGSVTKTFHIVVGSNIPWNFDITDAERVGDLPVANMNGGRFRVFLENNQQGNGLLVGAAFSVRQWMKGWPLSRDGDGEFHIANIDTSAGAVLDGTGAAENYYYLLTVSPDGKRTYWTGNDGHYIRQKVGAAFDFDDMEDAGISPVLPLTSGQGMLYNRFVYFANGGTFLYVADGGYKMRRFALGTPYDVTTLDVDSVLDQPLLNFSGYNSIIGMAMDATGTMALVSVSERKYLYQIFLPTPFDLVGASLIGTLDMSSASGYYSFSGLNVVNEGRTLIACTTGGVSEFSLSPSSS